VLYVITKKRNFTCAKSALYVHKMLVKFLQELTKKNRCEVLPEKKTKENINKVLKYHKSDRDVYLCEKNI